MTVSDFVGGLTEASGTFTGMFDMDSEAATRLFGPVPELIPIEIDTHDQPNGAAELVKGQRLTIVINDQAWVFPVDHAEPLDGNRVRVWCHRPVQSHCVE